MHNEKELYSLLIQKPEEGLKAIIDCFTPFVWSIVYGNLSGVCGKHDMEECVSDVFYEIYRNRDSIDLDKGSLKSYITILAKRKAIGVFRKEKKRLGDISVNEVKHDQLVSDDDFEQKIIDGEISDILIREIELLGEPDSQIILYKYYLGQSTKSISKALGIKANTVDKRASRALAKLRQALGGAL